MQTKSNLMYKPGEAAFVKCLCRSDGKDPNVSREHKSGWNTPDKPNISELNSGRFFSRRLCPQLLPAAAVMVHIPLVACFYSSYALGVKFFKSFWILATVAAVSALGFSMGSSASDVSRISLHKSSFFKTASNERTPCSRIFRRQVGQPRPR